MPVSLPEPQPAQPLVGSLPQSYDTKCLLLIPQDPHWLYAQWDFNRSDLIRYSQVASDGRLRLRLYKEEVMGHPMLEAVVGTEALHQFVPVAEAGVNYLATLGYYLGDGSWVTLCTSDKVPTPQDLASALKPALFQPPPPVPPQPEPVLSLEDQAVSTETVSETTVAQAPSPSPEILLDQPALPTQETKTEESKTIFELTDHRPDQPETPSAQPQTPNQPTLPLLAPEPLASPVTDSVPLPAQSPESARIHFPSAPAPTETRNYPASLERKDWDQSPPPFAEARVPQPVRERVPPEKLLPPVEVIHPVLQKYLYSFLIRPISSAERPAAPPGAGLAKGGQPVPEVLPLPEWFFSGIFPAVSSLQARAMPQPGQPDFWLQVNAELVIYGKTLPNALVKIANRPIRLRSDGTFSYRFALPDGQYYFPIQATSADGLDTRQARLSFQRQSQYSGQVGAVTQDPTLKPPHPEQATGS